MIIATYNRAASLPATLDGLFRQTYRPFEVIVVVGPCTDNTLEVLQRYPSVRVARCPEARLGLARNYGVNIAAGEITAFIDDDAVPREKWLAQLVDAYADPVIDAAGGFVWDAINDCMQWKICVCSRSGDAQVDAPEPDATYQRPGADPFLYLAGCNMSLRRSVVQRLGGFNGALSSTYEDVDMFRRVIDAGLRVVVLPDALVDHGVAANEMRDAKRNVRDSFRAVRDYGVYISHNLPLGAAREEIPKLVFDFAGRYHADVHWQVSQGTMQEQDRDYFLGRIEEGKAQGIEDGKAPRVQHLFDPENVRVFRPLIQENV